MLDSTLRKNGQRSYKSCRTATRSFSGPAAIHCSNAEPVPYQPGSMTRDWLQASTHGMARRSAIDCVGLREGGRLPILSDPISLTGVEALKYSTKPVV